MRSPSAGVPTLAAFVALVAVLSITFLTGSASGQTPDTPDPSAVQSVFDANCLLCHGGEGATLGLDLSSLEGTLAGSDRGAVVVPGDPEASELILRIRGDRQPRMPLTGPPWLSDDEIALLTAWVASGASTQRGAADAGTSDPAPSAPPSEDAAESVPAAGSFADAARILSSRCGFCHMPDGAMGPAPEGLVLTNHAARLAGGERVVIVPGNPLASELLRRVVGLGTPRMPFDGPPWLDEADVESLRAWIEAGAPGPDGLAAPIPVGREVRYEGTLTGRWELDGMPFQLGPNARVEDAPMPGDRVEVRGIVTADGLVQATRVRAR